MLSLMNISSFSSDSCQHARSHGCQKIVSQIQSEISDVRQVSEEAIGKLLDFSSADSDGQFVSEEAREGIWKYSFKVRSRDDEFPQLCSKGSLHLMR